VAATPDPAYIPSTPGTAKGREVAIEAGCLGCHRLGAGGNSGPGHRLTQIGAQLSRGEIERALRQPDPPMPPYDRLSPTKFEALLDYLASLR
jgi:ubiquinol-cytochrome c reductase cytochrome b subunit/menaquinol-cytochrome c reductase cytochrome b/c subunit